jgi:hypothetical protein
MASLGSLNKYWYWALLLAVGAGVAAAALVAPGKIRTRLSADEPRERGG